MGIVAKLAFYVLFVGMEKLMTYRNHTSYGVNVSLELSILTELGTLMSHTSLGVFNLKLI